ncbi:unnamed protein product [Adineta steineri]|uniref:Small acidic protein n=1 Tax=Adineta steineri TaxID=433720 RepID=A0A818Y6H4_9BILA|nr:unnamed protein product [Adineta steineri]CAF3749488.1 unnamed protein product [Adineta steineri]
MSTIDNKKALSSSKYPIREHHDDNNDNIIETKDNIDEIIIEQVHTVNDWEHADLGDEQRKQKFLRLMGAKKRKDEGRIDTKDIPNTVHEDQFLLDKKHCRSKVENETIDRELEKQFNEGLQSKILHTHHEGLGFYENETANNASSSQDWHHQQITTKFVPAKLENGSLSNSKEETKLN